VLGKVADMQNEAIRPPFSGVIPEPIRPSSPASSVLARLLSALRGDKCMAGAYTPDRRGAAPDAEPSTTPALSGTKGR
jgi:hypothetical protein